MRRFDGPALPLPVKEMQTSRGAASVKERTGNRLLKVDADGFADRFEPLSVHVYEVTPAAN